MLFIDWAVMAFLKSVVSFLRKVTWVGYTWTPAKYEADDDRYAGTLKVWRGGSPSGLASKPSRSKQTEDRDEAGMRLVSQNFHLDNLDNLEPGHLWYTYCISFDTRDPSTETYRNNPPEKLKQGQNYMGNRVSSPWCLEYVWSIWVQCRVPRKSPNYMEVSFAGEVIYNL